VPSVNLPKPENDFVDHDFVRIFWLQFFRARFFVAKFTVQFSNGWKSITLFG
jgi:hypothetical protein